MNNVLFYHENLSVTVPLEHKLGTKGDFGTTTNGQAGGLLARTGSLSYLQYKQQPRSKLLDSVISR
ncbi:hypothetical protein J6590_087879 [Homalodisca vitripennis]|nr:hypothetical protein J6590_087879 [Homalodisca vitripennis]